MAKLKTDVATSVAAVLLLITIIGIMAMLVLGLMWAVTAVVLGRDAGIDTFWHGIAFMLLMEGFGWALVKVSGGRDG